jgi:fibronectin-binding autotransporter adhesin
MKTKIPHLILAGMLGASMVSKGAPYTWDASGGAPLNDGGGTWNPTGGTNWETGGVYGAWGNTTADTAVIGVSSGAAGTINQTGTVNINTLTFNAPGSGNYTINQSSGTTNLLLFGGASPTIDVNHSATITNGGNDYIQVASGSDLTIDIAAGQTLTTRKLRLDDQNSDVVVTGGGTLGVQWEAWNPFMQSVNGTGSATLFIQGNSTVQLVQNFHSISDNVRMDIASGSTFDVNNYQEGLGYISGGGDIINLGGTGVSGSGLTLDLPSFHSGSDFSGTIDGTGGLTLRGNQAGGSQKIQILSGANTYTGNTYINNGGGNFTSGIQLQLANASGAAIQGDVIIGNDTGGQAGAVLATTEDNQFGASSVVSFNTISSGYSYFELRGTQQTIAGLDSTGSTNRVTVQNQEGGTVGAATLTINNTADYTYNGIIRDNFSGTNVGALSIVKDGTGTQTLSGNNTYTGNVTVNDGTLQLQGGAFSGAARNYSIASGAVLNLDGGVDIADAGTSVISGDGTLLVTGGTLSAPSSNDKLTLSLGSGALIDIEAGGEIRNGGWQAINWTNNLADLNVDGTLDIWDGSNVKVDALTGTGTITKGQQFSSRTLEVGVDNGSGTFSGSIGEGGGAGSTVIHFTKSGTGTQTLSGANTYGGTTTVSEGTLSLASTYTHTGTGDFIVNGGTLKVADGVDISSSAMMTISLGGVISPGDSPGTAITGSETWDNGGSYLWEINKMTGGEGADPGWDWLDIQGTLTINPTFNILITSLDLSNNAGLADGFDYTGLSYLDPYASFTIATATDGVTDFDASWFNLDDSAFLNSKVGWSIENIGNEIVLNAFFVPEPSSTALLGLGLSSLLLRRRRS